MNTELYRAPVAQMADAVATLDYTDKHVYGNYLAQTYYYVSHSTRMLAFAAGRMAREDETYFRRFIRHIGEESSHEVLAEKDLHDLSLTPQDFPHLPETHSLWECQYYKMDRQHPLALMGYIIALELFAGYHLPKFYADVSRHYEGRACRFIKLHAEEDPDHIEKAIELTATLSEPLKQIILLNVHQTAKAYAALTLACRNVAPAYALGAEMR